MTDETPPSVKDMLVRDATSVPDLIKSAEKYDPALAESLTEKSLVGSRTVWFPPVAWAVGFAASHYGVQWDDATSASIASILSWAILIVVRYFTRSPIGSLLPAKGATSA